MQDLNVKLSLKQKMILFEAMAKNHTILDGRPKLLSELRTQNLLWRELVTQLNGCDGPKKNTIQWKKSWTYLRKFMKKKYIKSKEYGSGGTMLADYEKHMIEACGLQSSDEELDHHSECETLHGSQSNAMKLEPTGEGVSKTSESSGLEIDYDGKKTHANLTQKKILIEAMAKNHKILEGRPNHLSARRLQNAQWKELIVQLNKCGPEKNMAQWRKSWTDMRLFMKKKYTKSKKCGGKGVTLTDYEKYVIKACGLRSSDDESNSQPGSEVSHTRQPSVVKLEPTSEDISQTSENLDLDSELNCHEEDVVKLEVTGEGVSETVESLDLSSELSCPEKVSGDWQSVSETAENVDLNPEIESDERKPHVNLRQKKILIEAMAKNHSILEGRPNHLSARRSQTLLWKELVAQLNECGHKKNMAQWRKSWSDMRLFMKKKYKKSKKYGGKEVMLTDYEKYIIKACGMRSSDDESDNNLESEVSHGSQPNAVKLEPTGEAVSGTVESLDLSSELSCREKNMVELEPMAEDVSETSEISDLDPNCHHRKRQMNLKQKKILIEAMAKNHHILEGRPKLLTARRSQYILWKQLIAQLNKCGPEKDLTEWRKTWTNLRMFVKNKYTKSKKYGSRRIRLMAYEKYMIETCGLRSSDDESDSPPESEASHGRLSSTFKSEPMGEDISENCESSDLDSEFICHEKNLVKLEPKDESTSETLEIMDLGLEFNCQEENVVKLESTGERVSESVEIPEVNLEVNCQQKDLIRDTNPIEEVPKVEDIRGTDLNTGSTALGQNLPLQQDCRTEKLSVNSSDDLQHPISEKTDSSVVANERILTEIRRMHENLLNESKRQTNLLEIICQSFQCSKNKTQ